MRIDNAGIGRLAANYLLARLSGETPPPVPPLVPDFIERGSTAGLMADQRVASTRSR
jgi:hypothetical protein